MLKILILDDHFLFVEGLCHILNSMIDKLTIFEAACGKDGLAAVDCHNDLDLVLLEMSLPDATGLEILEKVRQSHPLLPVIILSASDNQVDMCQALTLGASGFIHKSSKGKALLHIIGLVLSGETYIPPVLLSKLSLIVGDVKLDQPDTHFESKNESRLFESTPKLTPRQREVLDYIASGLSNKEISGELCISEATVKSHVASVLKVLKVPNRIKAAQFVFKLQ